MRPILLATDGSPSALEATREALELARTLSVPLVVVAVEHVSVPAYGYYGYGEVFTELRKAEAEHVHHVLEDVTARARELDVACTAITGTGPVAEAIVETARDRDAGMIVIGAHGWGTVRRFVFGSVSLAVLHDSPCPVLIARAPAVGATTWVDERLTAAV